MLQTTLDEKKCYLEAEWTAVFIYSFLTTTVAGGIDVRSSILFSIHVWKCVPGKKGMESNKRRLFVTDRQDEGSPRLHFS